MSSEYSSPEDVLKPERNFINTDIVIKQFAADVVDFSSQYGNDFSISYTAYNITGKPSKYPDYGDFPESYAMVIELCY